MSVDLEEPPVRGRSSSGGVVLVVVVVAALVASGFYLARSGARLPSFLESPDVAAADTTPPLPTDPPGPADESTERLLPAITATASGSYAFATIGPDGEPARYSPCSTIRYAVNLDGAPANAREVIDTAVARISATTGLAFADAGTTDDPLGVEVTTWEVDQGPPPPVLVGFATGEELPSLAGDVAGVGGSSRFELDGREYLFSGEVALDETNFDELAAEGRTAEAVAIVAHEFAHVVGLDHVDAPGELMQPVNTGLTDFGPGDLAGLAIAGSGPCYPTG